MLSKTTKIAVLTTAVAAAVATPVAAATPSTADRARTARVSGSGEIRLTFSPDRDIRTFTFKARAVPYSVPRPGSPHGLPTDARGTVKISHHSPQAGWTVRAEAKVDCLATSPGNATFTAVVTKADEPIKDWTGKRFGLSVHDGADGGPDRVGFSWAVVNGTENEQGEWEMGNAGTCMGPAAFAPVTKGGFHVRHADLLPPPQN